MILKKNISMKEPQLKISGLRVVGENFQEIELGGEWCCCGGNCFLFLPLKKGN